MKSNKIFKYDLGVPCTAPCKQVIYTDDYAITKILDIQMQGTHAVMWAEVMPHEGGANITIETIWTGECAPTESDMVYISTIQEPETGLVYHYYCNQSL